MQNVNLLDPRLLPREPVLRSEPALIALAAALLAVAAHGAAESQLTRRAVAAASAAAAPEAMGDAGHGGPPGADGALAGGTADGAGPDTADPASAHQALRRKLAHSEALLAALGDEAALPRDPAAALHQVVAALPHSMWLTEIELAGARELRIAGGALQPQALTQFARRLNEAQALQGTGLQTLRLEPLASPARAADAPAAPPMHRFVLASTAEAAGSPR